MQPIECKHHLKSEEYCKYRDGVTLKRPVKKNCGSWVDIGLKKVYFLLLLWPNGS